jgi:glyoxylase-like metal-dependent hydrolase (beta-lactamase superfamily II)
MLRNLLSLLLYICCLNAQAAFTVTKLADGIYATVRNEPPGFAVESNSLFIIGPRDVIVVDAQSNLPATRETLAALRALTDKPVRYVVNTHWHDDHIVGNAVYREAFPGVAFIGHANARTYLQGPGIATRAHFHKDDVPSFSGMLEQALKDGKNLAGKPISDEERSSYGSDLALAHGYATVAPDFHPELPDLTLTDRLDLYQGERQVSIRYLGRGHTSGDIVVWLPKEGIVAAGDLVVWPVPLIGGDQSHVADWPATLDHMMALRPAIIVPGHGPILRDGAYVGQMQAMMRAVTERTRAAMANGAKLDAVRKVVKIDDFIPAFAGDSTVRQALFRMAMTVPAITSAFNDLNAAAAAQ